MQQVMVRTRVEPELYQRLEGLQQETGLSHSEKLRSLIRNAVVIQRPLISTALESKRRCCLTFVSISMP